MRRFLFASIVLAVALAGCGDEHKPQGQVIATVNDEEITRPEVNAAISRGSLAAAQRGGQDLDPTLEALINQRVLTQEAKRLKLDQSQTYLLASRQANDRLLADLLANHVVQSLHPPSEAEVDAFVSAHALRFAGRLILRLDQVRGPAGPLTAASLRDVHTLDGVLQRMKAAGLTGERGRASLDTATLADDATRQLLAVPSGEPFVVNQGGALIASVIVQREAAPLIGDAARRAARALLRDMAARETLEKQLKALRNAAKIQYQSGFGGSKPARPQK